METPDDLEWRQRIEKISAKLRSECGHLGINEVVISASEAVGQALLTPGCLVRVTIKNLNHAGVFKFVRQMLVLREQVCRTRIFEKTTRSVSGSKQEVITVDLINGSGIEFVLAISPLLAFSIAAGADLVLNGAIDASLELINPLD